MFHNSCPPLDTHPSSRGHVRKHGAVLILIFSGAWRPENTENSALKSTSSEEKVSLQTQTRHQKEVQHPPAGTKTEFRWTATKGKFPFRKKVLRALISAWSGERYLRCIFVQCRGLWLEPCSQVHCRYTGSRPADFVHSLPTRAELSSRGWPTDTPSRQLLSLTMSQWCTQREHRRQPPSGGSPQSLWTRIEVHY